MGFGNYQKNEKKKLSQKKMQEKAKRMENKNPVAFKLPELVRKDK